MARKVNNTVVPLPEGVELNGMVSYYLQGWRTGFLEEVNGNEAGIRPMSGYRSSERKRLVYVYVVELRPAQKIVRGIDD